jgi:hypothetical protein
VALLVSLFLSWFKPDISGWEVFEFVDLLLAAIAVAALVGVFGRARPQAGLGEPPPSMQPALGLLALILVLAAVINHPPAAIGRDADTGLWVALAGAALMALGALLTLARVSLVVSLTPRERRAARDSGAAAPASEPSPATAAPAPEPSTPATPANDPAAEAPLADINEDPLAAERVTEPGVGEDPVAADVVEDPLSAERVTEPGGHEDPLAAETVAGEGVDEAPVEPETSVVEEEPISEHPLVDEDTVEHPIPGPPTEPLDPIDEPDPPGAETRRPREH